MMRWHVPNNSRGCALWMKVLQSRTLVTLGLLFTLLFVWNNDFQNDIQWPNLLGGLPFSQANDDGSGPYWHLLVPATSSNSRLCKTLLTSLIHNYPPPTFINWGRSGQDLQGYDPTTGKIWGVLQFLRGLDATHDNDMVLMIDGHDVWFQLRPEVLMGRYLDINKAANDRLKKQFGPALMKEHNISQTIIFGAEKYCWPNEHNTAHCYAVPESPLPRDTYGVNTDHGYKNNRPRWLNSGTVMGPVGDMRRLFEHVHQLWLDEPNNPGMDQYYFGELFGQQEVQRHMLRNSSEWIHTFEWYEPQDLVAPKWPSDGQTEFHIGLDYGSTMFQTLNVAWDDLSFVRYNGQDDIFEIQKSLGIKPSRKVGMPADVSSSRPPMVMNGEMFPSSGMGRSNVTCAQWGDAPLCTNFRSEAVPVAVHHNGDKSGMESMWKKMWFLPSAKEALQRNSVAHGGPIVLGSRRGNRRSWWAMRRGHKGGWSDSGVWLSWESLCSEHEGEIYQI